MIRSIFTRDGHPRPTDPAVPEAIIAVEMKFGDTIPTGTYLDMAANLPIVDPKKVLSPVLMIRGELGRQLDQRGPARFLHAAAERRPPVRHPAGHRAQPGLRQEPAPVVVRGEELPGRAGADRGVVSQRQRRTHENRARRRAGVGARPRIPRRHVPLPQPDGRHGRHHRQLPAFDGAQRQGFRLAAAPAQLRAVPLPARRRSQFRARRRDDAGHGRLFPGGHVLRPADQRRRPRRPSCCSSAARAARAICRARRSSRAWMRCARPARSTAASIGATKASPASATWTASRRSGSRPTAGRCNSRSRATTSR